MVSNVEIIKQGKDAIKHLKTIRDYFEDNMEALKELESSNGWGTWKGTLMCINEMIISCIENPTAVWNGD